MNKCKIDIKFDIIDKVRNTLQGDFINPTSKDTMEIVDLKKAIRLIKQINKDYKEEIATINPASNKSLLIKPSEELIDAYFNKYQSRFDEDFKQRDEQANQTINDEGAVIIRNNANLEDYKSFNEEDLNFILTNEKNRDLEKSTKNYKIDESGRTIYNSKRQVYSSADQRRCTTQCPS